MALRLAAGLLLPLAAAQQAGTLSREEHPPVQLGHCSLAGGCKKEMTSLTLDANWRWLHGVNASGSGNCYTGTSWDEALCPDPKTCAEKCALEGVTQEGYKGTYGVTSTSAGVELRFVTQGPYSKNVGSRLYMVDASGASYKLFKLKNREFAFDVDTSALPCGLNGAVYFVSMEVDGEMGGTNKAGAKYGTGYCDAQCPHDVKFMGGEANILDWDAKTGTGRHGHCCSELDIWEANKEATAFTAHPCTTKGPLICDGVRCGDDGKGEHYKGVCDKDGCDYNSWRMGNRSFYGPGLVVDTTKPVTVITQFVTVDGTDDGDLAEMRRVYVQDGRVIPNSEAVVRESPSVKGNAVTDAFCDAQKSAFGDVNDFARKGGMKRMGDALDRGLVLVVSLWDDSLTHMLWLDSASPVDAPASKPGVARGPCAKDSGKPEDVRSKYPDATVRYGNFKVGEIGSTHAALRGSSVGVVVPASQDALLVV